MKNVFLTPLLHQDPQEGAVFMYRIAIVDDEQQEIEKLQELVRGFFEELGEPISLSSYPDGMNLLRTYTANDILFLDIKMDVLDGLETAKLIRKLDGDVVIIFVTRMAQFAIQGYEVNALDFIVKPADRFSVNRVLTRALEQLRVRRGRKVILKTQEGLVTVSSGEVLYVEVFDHDLVYHTLQGDYRTRGTLSEAAESLGSNRFAAACRSHVVNLAFVKSVGQDTVTVGEEKIPLSRSCRKEFIRNFTKFVGEY